MVIRCRIAFSVGVRLGKYALFNVGGGRIQGGGLILGCLSNNSAELLFLMTTKTVRSEMVSEADAADDEDDGGAR